MRHNSCFVGCEDAVAWFDIAKTWNWYECSEEIDRTHERRLDQYNLLTGYVFFFPNALAGSA